MLQAVIHAVDIQDRDGGAMLWAAWFGLLPFLLKRYADGGCQGPAYASRPSAAWCGNSVIPSDVRGQILKPASV